MVNKKFRKTLYDSNEGCAHTKIIVKSKKYKDFNKNIDHLFQELSCLWSNLLKLKELNIVEYIPEAIELFNIINNKKTSKDFTNFFKK